MTICINGNKQDVPNGTTVQQLIELFQLREKAVVCELNRKVIERSTFSEVQLKDNDALEIVHFVGGG